MHRRPFTLAALALATLVVTASPAAAQRDRTDFHALAIYTAIPERGEITCPGGSEPSPSLMPPWCGDTRTKVRDRVVTGSIVQSSDWRVGGATKTVMNMNLDPSFEGPIWGTYVIDVPGHGTWEGVWQGQYFGPTLATYRLVAHGSGEFEGFELRALLVWQAGKGESITGRIFEPPTRRHRQARR